MSLSTRSLFTKESTCASSQLPARPLPLVIQGGMGVAVSGWQLAGAIAREGQMGVVAGTALGIVNARRLQLGDQGGHLRRACSHFPLQAMAKRVVDRYYVPRGVGNGARFKSVPLYTLQPQRALLELELVASFAEVFLAREKGAGGLIGINSLLKIPMPLMASTYGAMLAGVDYVLVGAGSPHEVPSVLDKLSRGDDACLSLKVQYATPGDDYQITFSPEELMGGALRKLARPKFLAIVSSNELAAGLAAQTVPPDGFVVEGHVAGGHNAPPRGPRRLDRHGQPIYGERDVVDPSKFSALKKPFWLAGSYGTWGGLERALGVGASGIQVGTAFALCRESGLSEQLKRSAIELVRENQARIKTDPLASPTSFPFKVLQLSGSLSERSVYEKRQRVCDLGALRTPFKTKGGSIGYRCPAESESLFVRKGGRLQNTTGRVCLCNGLMASVGLGTSRGLDIEPPLVTAGDGITEVGEYLASGQTSYSAADVLARLDARGASREPVETVR
jgi:nitronate monooxygenase